VRIPSWVRSAALYVALDAATSVAILLALYLVYLDYHWLPIAIVLVVFVINGFLIVRQWKQRTWK